MRTDVNIDDRLLSQARKLTRLRAKREIVHRALEVLVQSEARWYRVEVTALRFLGVFLNASQGAVEKSWLLAQAAEALENETLHRLSRGLRAFHRPPPPAP